MMRKKILRAIALCCVLASLSALFTFAVGCNGRTDGGGSLGGITFEEEKEKVGPQFLEGALADIKVNDTVVLGEYIEYVSNAEYTVTIEDEDGNVRDVTRELTWRAEAPGDYVMTYTIKSGKSKGTSTFTLHARYPELTWEFSLQNLPYNLHDTLIFEDYFSDMNIYASLENWDVYMDSVTVDGDETDLSGQDRYTFESMSDHTFKFHIESSDGQTCEGREVISIKYINGEYMRQLESWGISTYGELYVDDGNFTMTAGSYANGNNIFLRRSSGPHNLPYIAYNGEYGANSYVQVDFTGRNMPTFSFFRNDYGKSIFDGTKGIVYTGGFTDNNGDAIHAELCSKGMLYGPYMLNEYDQDMDDTRTLQSTGGSASAPFAGSLNSLEEGTRYRMIFGFSGIRKDKANHIATQQPVDTLFLTFDCAIINLDTQEIFSKFTMETYGIQALGFDRIPLDTENNAFFKGNIVLYGQHGRPTKLDKIYPVITGKTFAEICDEQLRLSKFKGGVQTFFAQSPATLTVADYVDTTAEDYIFFYRDENGVKHDVTGETFTLSSSGSYVLYYSDGEHLCTTLNVFVGDFDGELLEWVQSNNLNFYGLGSLSAGHAVTLKAGTIGNGATYAGPNENNLISQSFMAFDGNYGLNTYVVFDFTGKNMPEIAFFSKNYNNSMYYQYGDKQGIVVVTGITQWDGSVSNVNENCTAINYGFPYMLKDAANGAFVQGAFKESALGRANLIDGKHYRAVMGFTGSGSAITLNWYLYDIDAKTVVEQSSMSTWNFFTGDNEAVNNMTIDDLIGSIVLYGKFGVETKLDKVHGVFGNATLSGVVDSLNANEKFTVTFEDVNGNVLKTLTNVAYGTTVTYDEPLPTPEIPSQGVVVYSYDWDRDFAPIKSNTVYRLVLVESSKYGKTNNATLNGDQVVLKAGSLGAGADYTGPNDNDLVSQAYFAFDGNYGLNSYVAFDFTGKNMPEIAFFAKNYNASMYYQRGGKSGMVVASGITLWDGTVGSAQANNTQIGVSGPFGARFLAAENGKGGNMMADFDSALARANLNGDAHYRIVIGFTGSGATVTLNWYLYNLDTKTVVEERSMTSWGFFTGDNAAVNNMTVDDLIGSIVLYGKFGTDCTIDKIHGVFENATLSGVVDVVNANEKFTVTFEDADGNVLKTLTNVAYGTTVTYTDPLPTPEVPSQGAAVYSYEWDGAFTPIKSNTVYRLVLVANSKYGKTNNVVLTGDGVVLNEGSLGSEASCVGPNANDLVSQAYFAFDGNYGLNSYVAFDFTGNNMPEIAFFAKNYNASMYYQYGGKQGIVVVTGITNSDGTVSEVNGNGTQINYGFPFMLKDANDYGFVEGGGPTSALGRANLIGGKHYRVVMGFTSSGGRLSLQWYLYDIDTKTVVEQSSLTAWNFFTGDNASVNNMTLDDLVGSIVLYGKFGADCTIDRIHGVFENATLDGVVDTVNANEVFTVTFENADGTVIKTLTNVAYGTTVTYTDPLPTPEVPSTGVIEYSYDWDKAFTPIKSNTVYKLVLVESSKYGKTNNAELNGDGVVLKSGTLGSGADTVGPNANDLVSQAYFAFDGNYGLNSYVAFDFTGKNMPEVAFFAKNYNDSMYYQYGGKQGIVVVTGITAWDGSVSEVNGSGTQINYGYPLMIQNATHGTFVQGAFPESALGRANLIDGTHYRVIMGFTGNGAEITLHWCLYNIDTKLIVELSSLTTWGFFSGANEAVNNMTLSDLVGSIVLYGKFGTPCTVDKIHGVYEGTTLEAVANGLNDAKTSNVTVRGQIVLGAGSLGNGATYSGPNDNDLVSQAYFALDGNYGLNTYVTFDFTGKNMPEIAFFAKNYNDSMYYQYGGKQGIVVVTGITAWDGSISEVNGSGTQLNYGYPFMIQDTSSGGFVIGAFPESALGRANLIDGTHYRVIMGFSGGGAAITLHWCLYNLDTATVVEQSSLTTWGFFSGANEAVNNMTLDDLVGSIVLYGKFGTTCTVDKIHGIESGEFESVVAKYATNA